jgi:hypothetical protein
MLSLSVFPEFYGEQCIGWLGAACNTPKCRDTCDPVGGTCSVPGGCDCNWGYSGTNCGILCKMRGNRSLLKFRMTFDAAGFGLQYVHSSSLVNANDYLNAAIYLDLSSNTAFSEFKVKSC